jgi:hypothetical protein
MKLRIHIKNALTKEVEIDNTVNIINEDIEIIRANHQVLVEAYPDCHVNFEWPSIDVEKYGMNFIAGVPVNMERDAVLVAEGKMSWQEEMNKWYNCNYEVPTTIQRKPLS